MGTGRIEYGNRTIRNQDDMFTAGRCSLQFLLHCNTSGEFELLICKDVKMHLSTTVTVITSVFSWLDHRRGVFSSDVAVTQVNRISIVLYVIFTLKITNSVTGVICSL